MALPFFFDQKQQVLVVWWREREGRDVAS